MHVFFPYGLILIGIDFITGSVVGPFGGRRAFTNKCSAKTLVKIDHFDVVSHCAGVNAVQTQFIKPKIMQQKC